MPLFLHKKIAVSMAPQIIEKYVFRIKRRSSPEIISFQSIGEKKRRKR